MQSTKSIVGSLDIFRLPDVLQVLSSSSGTGRLDIHTQNIKASFVFESGKVVAVRVCPAMSENAPVSPEQKIMHLIGRLMDISDGQFVFVPSSSLDPDQTKHTDAGINIIPTKPIHPEQALIEAVIAKEHPAANHLSNSTGKEEEMPLKAAELDELLARLNDIDGAWGGGIVSDDGLMVASRLDKRFRDEKIAALASSAVSVCTKVVKEAAFGKTDTMLIEGTEGKMCITHAERVGAFILVIGSKDLNIGLARMVLDEVVDEFDAKTK